ncbi:CoA transferase [Pelagibius litoralis]|uniref:CoA transferase n=2 Tax=Pelagibius litoralis TaxID=374515 RepID=A0A967K711_9PROT|nr:CoA transferase [Pelagibius litoralis]
MSEGSAQTQSPPLSGLRVIDFTHVLAGPACAYFLGLLGAEVIKVESLDRGDAMRYRGGTDSERAEAGMSTAYLTQAAGKKSIALDLESSGGKAVMRRLIETADILVENHRPETMTALGFDEAKLQEMNPLLIHCAMTGYGRKGNMENAPAYDVNIQAACGLMALTGTAETGPLRTGAPVMDYATALAAGFAITAALHQRNRTGQGSFVDVSMLETAFTLMSSTITDFLVTGHSPQPRGNAANSRSPGAGNFTCKEGTLSLGVNEEHQFRALAKVLGRSHWLTDARFADRRSRKLNSTALEALIAEALLSRTADDWETAMIENGVPAARLRSLPESLALEQTAARRYLHRDVKSGLQLPTLPFRIGEIAAHVPAFSPPRLGEHSAEVLAMLGYSAAEIRALEALGVVNEPLANRSSTATSGA